jgi:SAM-dependent methyltransferase
MDDEQKRAATISREHFRNAYSEKPPWDIGRPQAVFRALADKVIGSVLDAGCGTGEHALFFASRGHEVTGFDFLEEAIAAAKRKAEERGLAATFLVKDALKLQGWPARFDNESTLVCSTFFPMKTAPAMYSASRRRLSVGGTYFCSASATRLRGRTDRDACHKPSYAMPSPKAGKSSRLSRRGWKFARSPDKHVTRGKTRAGGFWSHNALHEGCGFGRHRAPVVIGPWG